MNGWEAVSGQSELRYRAGLLRAGSAVAAALVALTAVALVSYRAAPGLHLPSWAPLAVAAASGLGTYRLLGPARTGAVSAPLLLGVAAATPVVAVALLVEAAAPAEASRPALVRTFSGEVAPAVDLGESFATAVWAEGDRLVLAGAGAYTATPAMRVTVSLRPSPLLATRVVLLPEGWQRAVVEVPAVAASAGPGNDSVCVAVDVVMEPLVESGWAPRRFTVPVGCP